SSSWCSSCFAHARGGFFGASTAHALLDPPADIGIDVLPVLEGALQHGAAHATEQAAGNLFDQRLALRVREDTAHQGSGLAEVVIIRTQGVGGANHRAVGLPAVLDRAGGVRPGTTAAVGGV